MRDEAPEQVGILPSPAEGRRPRRRSLTERVYEMLRNEIVTCRLVPGVDLSELDLAQCFDVSKTPVREALAMLRLDGLILTFPRKGYQVTPITFADINESIDLRVILEAGAGRIACSRITDAEIDGIQAAATTEGLASGQSRLTDFIGSNREFHMRIARASHNGRLIAALDKLLVEMDRFFYLGATLRDVRDETNDYHRQIIRALRARDVSLVAALLTTHAEATRAGLIHALTRSPGFGRMAV